MYSILITDFDGTLCRQDFYQLVVAHLLPANVPNYWQDYLNKKLTHFEVLRSYFAELRCDEAAVDHVLNQMELEPRLPALLKQLETAGWKVVIASAGCAWYIRKLLGHLEQLPAIHANPGEYVEGKGLLMSLPYNQAFHCPINGIDKAGIVKAAIAQVGVQNIAFAGDGLTDVIPALLTPEPRRYARSDCARALSEKKQKYQPFERWSEVAEGVMS